jgi:four helix bundle protein
MATWKRFEDIEAWQKARVLNREVVRFTKAGACAKDFVFIRQIRDASLSVMSNIAEGFERDGTKEFHQFATYAKGSAGEVRSQLYSAFDAEYLTEDEFERLRALAEEVSRMLAGLMKYLECTEYPGRKFS